MDRKLEESAIHRVKPLEERIKKYDSLDDEEERRPRGRLRSRREQLAVTEYDLYNV